eukprot:TRINITY_DN6617_c0_g1_i6.p1 TRINITY_DN6617_c0_g1~~TRINITY_DN6617_c0_g1_i6.p1  ORF type:complete len:277 (-),score=42.29 TRINITY_DN6617_c0_g1_i6:99-929(-)
MGASNANPCLKKTYTNPFNTNDTRNTAKQCTTICPPLFTFKDLPKNPDPLRQIPTLASRRSSCIGKSKTNTYQKLSEGKGTGKEKGGKKVGTKEMVETSSAMSSTRTGSLIASQESGGFFVNGKGFYGQVAFRSTSKQIIITTRNVSKKLKLNTDQKLTAPLARGPITERRVQPEKAPQAKNYSEELDPLTSRECCQFPIKRNETAIKAVRIRLNKCSTVNKAPGKAIGKEIQCKDNITETITLRKLKAVRANGGREQREECLESENRLTFCQPKN